jgi:hypothetical protein
MAAAKKPQPTASIRMSSMTGSYADATATPGHFVVTACESQMGRLRFV